MAFESMKGLTSSKMFPARSNFKLFNIRELGDMLFLYCMALHILNIEEEHNNFTKDYMNNTCKFGDFNKFQSTGNDLYQLLYVLHNEEEHIKLKESIKTTHIKNRMLVPFEEIKDYFIESYEDSKTNHKRMFFKLETGLIIKDATLKKIKNLVENWHGLHLPQKTNVLETITSKITSITSKAEILTQLEALSHKYNIDLSKNKLTEGTIRNFERPKLSLFKKFENVK